jgi:hypothetical protein
MKLVVVVLLFMSVAGCSYIQKCELETDVSIKSSGNQPKELLRNAVPRADVSCPF